MSVKTTVTDADTGETLVGTPHTPHEQELFNEQVAAHQEKEVHSETCIGCGITLEAQVLNTPAGHYVGTWCNNVNSPEIPGMGCGPHDRWSHYYPTAEAAQTALDGGSWIPRY